MKYVSTRGGAEARSFGEIVIEGLAPDGGLYVPEHYPRLYLDDLRGKTYQEIALAVFAPYATDIPFHALKCIVEKSYTEAIFGSTDITPLKKLDADLYLLQLSNGPTLAFKDVAMQILGNLLEYLLQKGRRELNVLGATSGDTGSAAAYALRGKKGINLFMLSPYGRMSPFQALQMYTLDEPNIFNLVADVPFDDLQTIVKEVNADSGFKTRYKLGAVNSINWARVVAQTVYYVYAYLQATTHNNMLIDVAVPSGNFGNALAAHVARQMGVPIRRIIVATNENDVLHEFFATGMYRVRKAGEVRITTSPSMDIASASNFERLVYDAVGQNAAVVARLWKELKEGGSFDGWFISTPLSLEWKSGCATETIVWRTIRDIWHGYKVLIDPHTAVGMCVGLRERQKGVPLVVAETAQPAKFADTIKDALGFEPPVPSGYEQLGTLKEHIFKVPPNSKAVKEFIAAHV